MKNITAYITESTNATEYVAIEDKFEGDEYSKPRTSYRVVSADTFADLQRGYKERKGKYGRSREMPVGVGHTYTVLGTSKTRRGAEEMLPGKEVSKRKTAINKGDADYIVYAISSGKMNPAGKTTWDWSIYDDNKDGEIYLGRDSILFGATGSLAKGDKICVVDNDTQKKLTGAPNKITAVCKCTKEDFEKMVRSHESLGSLCKRPTRAFGKVSDGLPWSRFGQMYSIKGVE